MNYYKSIPTDAGSLIELGTNMVPGLTDYGTTLKLTVTPAQMETAVGNFITDNNRFAAARTALQTASTAAVTALDALLGWVTAVKNDLVGSFGPLWNSEWVQVGFQTPSIAIPDTRNGQATLAEMMIGFFTASPTYQDADKNLTPAYGKTLQDAIASTLADYTAKNKAIKGFSTAWDASYAALLKTERDLLKLLQVALPATDPRWLDFGLALPGTPSTPGQPTGLMAELNAAGHIAVACDATPLATRYRFRMLLVNVETDYRLAASSPAPMAVITGVLPGQTVQIIVQAVNGNLQGAASVAIQFTVLLPVHQLSAAVPAQEGKALVGLAPLASGAVKSNGNGHANGFAEVAAGLRR